MCVYIYIYIYKQPIPPWLCARRSARSRSPMASPTKDFFTYVYIYIYTNIYIYIEREIHIYIYALYMYIYIYIIYLLFQSDKGFLYYSSPTKDSLLFLSQRTSLLFQVFGSQQFCWTIPLLKVQATAPRLSWVTSGQSPRVRDRERSRTMCSYIYIYIYIYIMCMHMYMCIYVYTYIYIYI